MSATHAGWSARLLRPDALTAAEREIWNHLWDADAGVRQPFLTPAFTEAVGRVFTGARIAVLERNGSPAGFFPFQFPSALHRILGAAERIGGVLSDYAGAILPADAVLAPERLLSLCGLSTYTFDHLDETQLAHGLTGEKPEYGLRIRIGSDPASYLARLKEANKDFIQQVGRRRRRLTEEHGPLRLVVREEDGPAALARLMDRKRAQYRESGKADPFATPWRRRLLDELALSRDPRCQGVVSTLWAGETWVASHFGLLGGGVLHFWFPAYNPALSRMAPGHLLLVGLIERAAELGIHTIDRGAGEGAHKQTYLVERHRYYRGRWVRPGPRALVHMAGQSLAWRATSWSTATAKPLDRSSETA